jgi:phospholipid transport system substrate-binding protein
MTRSIRKSKLLWSFSSPLCGLASCLVLLTGLTLSSPAQAGPMSQLKQANVRLKKLARRNASDAKLKQFVNRLIGYDLMAEQTLRDHWAKLTAAQKSKFKKLFKGLIEKTYIKGIRKNAKYSVDYKGESIKGQAAKVKTVVHTVKRGRPRQTEVVYRMKRQGQRWVLVDMITDDVSLVRNYRKSFNRIIGKDGFATLLQKMRKKLSQ